jgi:hypothetical protein
MRLTKHLGSVNVKLIGYHARDRRNEEPQDINVAIEESISANQKYGCMREHRKSWEPLKSQRRLTFGANLIPHSESDWDLICSWTTEILKEDERNRLYKFFHKFPCYDQQQNRRVDTGRQ